MVKRSLIRRIINIKRKIRDLFLKLDLIMRRNLKRIEHMLLEKRVQIQLIIIIIFILVVMTMRLFIL